MEIYRLFITILLTREIIGFCLFGEQSAGCVFQCHCQGSAPCNDTTGSCPGGCADDVLSVTWRGPACQTGNIAFQKTAKESSVWWSAQNAIDGRVDGSQENVCAHTLWDGPGWWEVDLGGLFKVYNIIIYNRETSQDRLSQFWIAVRNSSTDTYPVTNTELCYENRTHGNPGDIVRIQCYRHIVGRYIRLSKYQNIQYDGEMFPLNFCEFIAIGHLYVDCSRCPSDKQCNDVTGCTECHGAYQPDCLIGITACEAGYYGINCKEECGQCRDNAACERYNGGCPGGCQLWNTGNQCKDYIELHGWESETVEVTDRTSSSLEVSWQPLSAVRADLVQYYGYTIYYRISGTVNFIKVFDVKHSSEKDAVLMGLVYNTDYDIYIAPYRQMEGETEHGITSPVITGKTACNAPDKPVLLSAESVMGANGTYSIFVELQPITDVSARCDAFILVFIEYMVANEYGRIEIPVDMTSYEIESLIEGSYSVRLTVVNNQNISATSDDMMVTVGQPKDSVTSAPEKSSEQSDVLIISVSVVVVVIVIAVAVTVIVYLILRQRRMSNGSRPQESDLAVISSNANVHQTEPPVETDQVQTPNVQNPIVVDSNSHYTSLIKEGPPPPEPAPEPAVYCNSAVYEELYE